MNRSAHVLAALVLGAVTIGTARAADGPHCGFVGSWLGYAPRSANNLVWMGTADGASSFSGTFVIDDPSDSASLNGVFPAAVRMTTLRGVWKRVDGRTFGYTVIGMGVDPSGRVVWINKKSGYATLSPDCGEVTVVGVQEAYPPTEDPYEGVPVRAYGLADRTAKRMRVYAPYPP